MKSLRALLFVALTTGILVGVAGYMAVQHEKARFAKWSRPDTKNPVSASTFVTAAPVEAMSPEKTIAAEEPVQVQLRAVEAGEQPMSNAMEVPAKVSPGGVPAKEPLKDPIARVALTLVGEDEIAEAYWLTAINDPSLSGNERQDLIEDLNEEGFSDPKHPTADDLPLIVRRLMIIEQVAPDAMDAVNADAFQEAYKDLMNLANLAMGDGEPVK